MIRNGDTVKIHYTLRVDGDVVDSSSGREPLSYVQGSGQIIPGLEEQLQGLKSGDKKSVQVPAEKGYGVHDPAAVQKVPKASFANAEQVHVGEVVQGRSGNDVFQATVTGVSESDVTLDLNHPLAGKTLAFDVEVVDVQGGLIKP